MLAQPGHNRYHVVYHPVYHHRTDNPLNNKIDQRCQCVALGIISQTTGVRADILSFRNGPFGVDLPNDHLVAGFMLPSVVGLSPGLFSSNHAAL